MRKLAVAVFLALISTVYIVIVGDTMVTRFYSFTSYGPDANIDIDDFTFELEQDKEVIKIIDKWQDDSGICLKLESVEPGEAVLSAFDGHEHYSARRYYVNSLGVITEESRFGNCNGGWIILICINIFFAYLIIETALKFRKSLKENFYSQQSINLLALIIILSGILLTTGIGSLFSNSGLAESVRIINASINTFSFFAIPVTFLVLIFVFISNIILMVKEGRSMRNLLGTGFFLAVLVMLVIPRVLDEWLQTTTLIDVHHETGWGNLFQMCILNVNVMVLTYMLSILLSTTIMGSLASRRLPAYDKDYIIILGCQIRKDGTLTPLLRGRADKAVDFAAGQKEKTGKDVIFVPSGGKGNDEVMAEGEAIGNYLESLGISRDRILVENRSVNTIENFEYSLKLIREHKGVEDTAELGDTGIAFATTGYHTFRSGSIATKLGIRAEGIGSKTKMYFGVNAFIRECIAILYYGKRFHIKVLIGLIALSLLTAGFLFMTLFL